jgi:hypothetical protein
MCRRLKISTGYRSGEKEATQLVVNVKFTLKDTSRSSISGHLLCSALKLRGAETATCASQLEAHLQESPVVR